MRRNIDANPPFAVAQFYAPLTRTLAPLCRHYTRTVPNDLLLAKNREGLFARTLWSRLHFLRYEVFRSARLRGELMRPTLHAPSWFCHSHRPYQWVFGVFCTNRRRAPY